MLKKNKWKIVVSSIIILLPILVGLLLWDKLPDTMATHWGTDGEANGFSSKAFVVFGMPFVLLAFHLICLLATNLDKKQINQSMKALGLIFWMIPAVSWFALGIIYSAALGANIDVVRLMPVVMGAAFIVIGNYLPKTKLNRTLGIKIKWTLESEENWNKTHRLCGKLWVIGGIIILLTVFLPETAIAFTVTAIIIALVIAPIAYSYSLARKQRRVG